VFLDIASRRSEADIKRRLPSMYHQFKELGDVDITKEPMEVAPTCHYVMGGVEVDADTQASIVPGLYAAGEVSGGMHGSNRLGGNSLSDLLVFGKRAGESAATYSAGLSVRPRVDERDVQAAEDEALAPFANPGGENPYAVMKDLQASMQSLVGIIRTGDELERALHDIDALKERAKHVSVRGTGRSYNPGWHTALDLRAMLTVSECIARAALERTESRGGHTRDDYPATDYDYWGTVNLVLTERGGKIELDRKPLPQMPDDLKTLFEESH
jgi:succinate dehydrogenase / fumarate reductase flavoprotein subunit